MFLKASEIVNIINYLEKKETDADSRKETIKHKTAIFKAQQRFKRKRHNVFTEKNKFAKNCFKFKWW